MFEFFNIISYFCSCLPYCATKRGRGYHCVCVCANSHGAAYRATWNANCPSPECTQLRLFVERTWDAHISAEPQKQHWINNVAILTPDRMKCVFALSGIVVDFFFLSSMTLAIAGLSGTGSNYCRYHPHSHSIFGDEISHTHSQKIIIVIMIIILQRSIVNEWNNGVWWMVIRLPATRHLYNIHSIFSHSVVVVVFSGLNECHMKRSVHLFFLYGYSGWKRLIKCNEKMNNVCSLDGGYFSSIASVV